MKATRSEPATAMCADPADSDAMFRAVADDAPVMLWMADANGQCTFFNREWLAFTGGRLAEQLGCGWLDSVHPDDREAFVKHSRRAARKHQPFTFEYRLRRADGQYRWILSHGSPRLAGDALVGYVGSSADITERKEAEVAVADTQHRFRQLIDNAQDMVYRMRLHPTRVVEYVSGAAEAITGHTPEEFYADPDLPQKAVHPDDAHLITEMLRDPAHLRTPIILRWIHRDGRVVRAEHRRVAVYDASGNLIALEGIARDLTDRIETQQRLRESEEQMRQLAGRVQTAREEERAELARELHDELGQSLTAIKLELGRMAAALKADRVGLETVDRLQSLGGLVDIGITTVKRIATNLRPPTLDHLGLVAALRWEAMAFRARTGLRCYIRTGREPTGLTSDQQTVLFRIVQEALTNVVRHAHASAAHVTLAERRGTFEVRIRDNGRGIGDSRIADPRAIGLLGMRERAAGIGGQFEIAGCRGKGTVVTIRVPTDPTGRGTNP